MPIGQAENDLGAESVGQVFGLFGQIVGGGISDEAAAGYLQLNHVRALADHLPVLLIRQPHPVAALRRKPRLVRRRGAGSHPDQRPDGQVEIDIQRRVHEVGVEIQLFHPVTHALDNDPLALLNRAEIQEQRHLFDRARQHLHPDPGERQQHDREDAQKQPVVAKVKDDKHRADGENECQHREDQVRKPGLKAPPDASLDPQPRSDPVDIAHDEENPAEGEQTIEEAEAPILEKAGRRRVHRLARLSPV